MRSFFLAAVLALTSCVHQPESSPTDQAPLDQHLAQFASLQNSGQWEALRTHFTKDATIQSPVTPQRSKVDRYLRAVAAEPYSVNFSGTETIYAFPGRAMTRSDAVLSAPGRFNLKEKVKVEWRLEDGYWRISRMAFSDWPAIVGTWKRSGLKQEGSIELRILPGGSYVIYTAEDYSAPAFRGRYRLEGNKITMADSSAFEASLFSAGEGSYLFMRTATGINFRKVEDANAWRTERFEGNWTSAY